MPDLAKRFEILILRPLQLTLIVFTAVLLFKGIWLWSAACFAGLLYLGVIGSKLHPLQTASDLAKGPLENPKAYRESKLLPEGTKKILLGYACTRVGILIGSATGLVVWTAFNWRWYFALLTGWLTIFFIGALLKSFFKTVR